MSTNDPILLLQDALEAIDKIAAFTAGMGEAQYEADTKTQFAVERGLLIIAEVAYRLRPDIDVLCPGVPWQAVRSLGNVIRHGYESVINRRIWVVVTEDLPELRSAVVSALERLNPQLP